MKERVQEKNDATHWKPFSDHICRKSVFGPL